MFMKTGTPLIRLKSVDSTNHYAASLINQQNAVNGMVITAYEQTLGKGQDQNQWESKAGENLTISILIQPKGLLPARQFMLNKITSLAVCDFVVAYLNAERVRIKWPNDIYIGDKKVAGILINNTIEGQEITWSVIGIGININQTVFESNAPDPVSLKQISGKDYNLDECLQELCEAFDLRFTQLLDNKYKHIDSDYLKSLYRYGVFAQYVFRNQIIKARITGIGEFGHLQIETADGDQLHCDMKEIAFVI
jgi:BirA family transcriptional regulator, biotin operon repressor / biotin---[acetyl-CoA-carboxylase] ligase